jgi:MtN3 and saliva related transmembrane protein
METTDLLGAIAGTLTTVAFVPQVVKTWRTRSAHDISLWMFLLFNTGLVLWLVYGLLIGATPIVIANSITLALALTILYFKLRYP